MSLVVTGEVCKQNSHSDIFPVSIASSHLHTAIQTSLRLELVFKGKQVPVIWGKKNWQDFDLFWLRDSTIMSPPKAAAASHSLLMT